MHARPPAFGGADGLDYSVSAFADPEPDAAGRYGAALLFVRWTAGADRPVGHLETAYLAFGASPERALEPLLAMPLRDVKAQLDRCIHEGKGDEGRGKGGTQPAAPARTASAPMEMAGVVLGRTGSTYRVRIGEREVEAVLRGRVKHRDDERVVAGDVVDLELHTGGATTITGVRPRRSVLVRREAGGRAARRPQPLAANVDQVVVVAATRDPVPNPRMLDRFFVIAEANGLPAALVVNKMELDREVGPRLRARYAPAGYRVLGTSVAVSEGLAPLAELLAGRASVLCGPSGAGKSSLLNALQPGLRLRTGPVSAKGRTGRHTTVAAELLALTGTAGGYVVDTPGLREVGTWGIDPNRLGPCFPEFHPYLDRCQFDDCHHLAEPGCAVRSAAAAGAFDADRLVSYERLYREVSEPSWSSGRRRAR
ncbi:MAG: ribosome small subunit-dependent GTPase A [Gemmatimonadales bacterium]